jgi:hypothetical protein
MRCPSCNNEVPEGKQFCGHCGHRLAPVGPATPAEFDEEAPTRVVSAEPEEPPLGPEVKAEPAPLPEPKWEPPPEVEAAPAVEELAPEKEAKEPQPPAVMDKTWLFAWLSTLGWTLGFALLAPIETRIRMALYQAGYEMGLSQAAIVWSITGIVGGLLTGVGLRRAVPGVSRWQVFLIAAGWVASLILSWPTGPQNIMELSYWALCGSILGLVAGLISHRRGASPWWKQALKVMGFVAGTGLAWVLAEIILDETLWSAIALHRVPFPYLAKPVSLIVAGGTAGFLTGLVWRRAVPSARAKQMLIVTVGWGMGLLLGILAVMVNAFTLAQQFRSSPDYTLVGVIGGAVGSGVMAWQLRRVHRGG